MSKKIIVVGGVAGGASFAARMRRLDEQAQIVIYEKGNYISFANCGMPYHIGQEIAERDKLLIQTPQRFKERFNIDVRVRSEVTAVDPVQKTVTVVSHGVTETNQFDYLVLSPGSHPLRPPIPGIDDKRIRSLRTIDDMDRIKSMVDAGNLKKTVVIGGGFIGIEMAENLRRRNCEVTLIEMADQIFIPADKEMAALIHEHVALNGVHVLLSDGVTAFEPKDNALEVVLKSGKRVAAELIILAIGVKTDTGFLKNSGIALSERGAIQVNEKMQTNYDAIFAVGDAIEVVDFVTGKKVSIPLAGPANRQGRIAADVIAGLNSTYKQTQGTAICRVFDLAIAVSGCNEKQAKANGIPYLKSYTHGTSHATYFPHAFPISLKILFSPENGQLLGAQVVGRDGVDKRIDVLATAIRHKLTVYDLTELELAYAPPYGSAKDPVNMAGFVAENILKKQVDVWYAEEAPQIDRSQAILLDVRSKVEVEQGTIPDAVNIPVDELRTRSAELSQDKTLYVFCQVGLRGYVASRMLMQQGFTVKNLSGGYKTYQSFFGQIPAVVFDTQANESSCSAPSGEPAQATIKIDACGMQCPGPIMKLKSAIDAAEDGRLIEISASEPGFAADMPAWCKRTGHDLVSFSFEKGIYTAIIRKMTPVTEASRVTPVLSNRKTLVVFSGDFGRAMASFIIANGAASMGNEVTMFFTFWGLNLLRRGHAVNVEKPLIEKLFGWMMPSGAANAKLCKMNFLGLGTLMMKTIMKNKNVYPLETLLAEAQKNGVRLIACTMTMDMLGITKEELIDGVELGGVATYLERADNAGYNLFI